MPVSKRRRFEVFKRDKFTCQYCGNRVPDVVLHCDHVLPKSKGGPNDIENLTTSCIDCNQGKSDVLLGDVAPALDEDQRLEALQEMAERWILIERQMSEGVKTRFVEEDVAEKVGEWLVGLLDISYVSRDMEQSLKRFAKELTPDQMKEAIYATRDGSAYSYDQWKYFCACCWKMIRGKWQDKKTDDRACLAAGKEDSEGGA